MRIRSVLVSLAAAVMFRVAMPLATANGAEGAAQTAPTKRTCRPDVIRLDGQAYVFYKRNMSCERSKLYARHVYESGGHWWPRKFKCSSGDNYKSGASCIKREGENEFFGWYPPD